MIKLVLLDLDNTLLSNPDMAFAQAYLSLVDRHFLEALDISGISQHIRRFIRMASDDQTGTQALYPLALTLLAEATGKTPPIIQTALADFYTQHYPTLAACVQPIAGAAALIRHLRDQDIAVVIATNPIYPETAIQQRMAWAQLPDEKDTYALITTAENMHFAKPDPAYYAEIVARVGVEPDEALLVGDSSRNDILPAHTIGIPSFQIIGTDETSTPEAQASGSLHDFIAITHTDNWRHTVFSRQPLDPNMIFPQYRGNIGALYGMLENVQPDFWHQRPDIAEWSILQILCHLRDSEDMHQRPRLQRILQEANPFIVAPRPPGPNIPECSDDGYAIAADFVRARQATMQFLNTLQPEDWQRPARHSIFGLTTLLEMALFTAQHDRLHLNQLCQTIGRCY
jgi:FMN phosphatase YigB (HAD superfamily)